MRTRNSIRGFVRPSVRPSVGPSVRWSVVIELESVKTRISAPAHPSATGIGRVSGLVFFLLRSTTWPAGHTLHDLVNAFKLIKIVLPNHSHIYGLSKVLCTLFLTKSTLKKVFSLLPSVHSLFSGGHATLHLAVSVGPSVAPSILPSVHPSIRPSVRPLYL